MKRPPKPRITKPRLHWKFDRHRGVWMPYHRTRWSEAGKRKERLVQLDWQGDAKRLDELYWQCQRRKHKRQAEKKRHTWAEAIAAWRADPRVQGKLSEATKKSYGRDMDWIIEKNGPKPMASTTRAKVRDVHAGMADETRKADKRLAVISLLWNYATEQLDWPLGSNPAKGIDRYGKQRSFEPWPDWMVKALADAPEQVRTAAELILGTGQRPNAAITMRRDQFQGEWMTVTDEKGDKEFEVFCPERLREYVASLPARGAHVLPKNLTEPMGYHAIETRFRTWRKGLGERAKSYSLHGLRKLAVIELAYADCSDAEIQAVTGQSAATVAYYRKEASRRKLSRKAQERRK